MCEEQLPTKDKSDQKSAVKIAPFRKNILKTSHHRHNKYFELIFFSDAEGYHKIDDINYPIHAPCMFFVGKDQLHSFDMPREAEGHVMIFKEAFLEDMLDIDLLVLFRKFQAEDLTRLRKAAPYELLFQQLSEALQQSGSWQKQIVQGLLKTYLALASQEEGDSKKEEYQLKFSEFQKLLQGQEFPERSVKYYAQELNISPQRLNQICQKAAQRNAGALIEEYLLLQVKRWLITSEESIAELAYRFHFPDASYFGKFFKRQTGLTPKRFKSEQ
ncbi:helix-turn-helix domain-containing protein [Persicobacter sp. CCB-QB2]|uniref:helix-turn-helix domain-containing protein n=1 Tax=Persicobacter sp. CCB-QB2 TaxID=1561025 RepID=UPI0006A9B270|nr:helix-turn-helix domain-containing protein [Persicobacter sp. CCB-QB2]